MDAGLILVTGSSGRIGRATVRELQSLGLPVAALIARRRRDCAT